jgi:iron(III) transport system substrate-binding protein
MRGTSRRQFLISTFAAGAAVTLAACGASQAGAPSGSPSAGAGKPSREPRWGMTPDQESAWEQVEAAADKEGTLTYYGQGVITPQNVPVFMEAWKKSYPNVKIELVNGTTADVQTRITTEQDARSYTGDVADISVRSGLLEAKRGYTQRFVPPAAADTTVKWTANRVYGDGDVTNDHMTWFPTWINTRLVAPKDEPKTHMDFLDPKWKGQILWYTPWSEGGGWNEYYWCKKVYGMDWVKGMIAQQPAFAQGTTELLTPLARGEYAIVMGSTGGGPATQMIKNGQPIKALWLDDFIHGTPTGHIMLNHAPHPNAAKLLLNWWISEEGQRFQSEVMGQFPVRSDVPAKEDWQKGVDHPKEHYNSAEIPEDTAAQEQKEAAGFFKK